MPNYQENGRVGAWADINNDGFLDLFIANFGKNRLFLNTGNENHWLGIRVVGTVSNRDGIGTRIEAATIVQGKSLRQMREVSAGGSRHSQDSLPVEFGLGDATTVDLVVTFPSGIRRHLRNVPANQFLTIREGLPDIVVRPSSHNFGSIEVGSTSAPQTFTILNMGNGDLEIGPITLTGTDDPSTSEFRLEGDTCSRQTIAPVESCTINAVFAPTSMGPKNARLTIPSNDLDTPIFDVVLSGEGIAHLPLDLSLNGTNFQRGDTLILTAIVTPGSTPQMIDAYVAVQLPGGTLLFLQGNGSFTTDIRPLITGWTTAPFTGEIFRYTFSGREPLGDYIWLAAFTERGSLNIIGDIAKAPFTFGLR